MVSAAIIFMATTWSNLALSGPSVKLLSSRSLSLVPVCCFWSLHMVRYRKVRGLRGRHRDHCRLHPDHVFRPHTDSVQLSDANFHHTFAFIFVSVVNVGPERGQSVVGESLQQLVTSRQLPISQALCLGRARAPLFICLVNKYCCVTIYAGILVI